MRFLALALVSLFFVTNNAQAQSTRNDIPVSKLPENVKKVLAEYITILRNSESLDDCAERMLKVAGGGLVNEDIYEDGTPVSLRGTVKPYSLKKDYQNIKFYASPIRVTRVNVSKTNGTGYGNSAVAGTKYKIWIAKKKGAAGMPAPISIIVPEGHKYIKTPKVIGIGSL